MVNFHVRQTFKRHFQSLQAKIRIPPFIIVNLLEKKTKRIEFYILFLLQYVSVIPGNHSNNGRMNFKNTK